MRIQWILLGMIASMLLTRMPAVGHDCDGLGWLSLPGTTVTRVQVVTEGSFSNEGGPRLDNLPPFCRVEGVITPTGDSNIRFEIWMPTSGWIGKFQGIGNGGFAGSIGYDGLADAVRHGYAAASTDTGHKGEGTDAAWALGHPDKIVDFGHRAIHEMTVKSKAIVAAYYGSAAKRSYFSSCSNGGRQALMEAQRYPEDYDGIIAGAPANYWTRLLLNAVSDLRATSGDGHFSSSKLPAIQAAAQTVCDAADGVKDGVIENPPKCKLDHDQLLCRTDSDQCLTAAQLRALKKLYGGLRDAKGRLLFPGYSPGGEADPGGWEPWITGRPPDQSLLHEFGTGFFRNMIFNDPAWDYKSSSFDREAPGADRLAQVLDATNPDLRRFHQRGGKLILYHGWNDAAIPAQNTIDYYESVIKKMGAAKAGSFVRLFMVPGMQHCAGGAGTSLFGQFGVAQGDPSHNIAAALEQWVEGGKSPEQIIAVKLRDVQKPESGIERTRPLCAYPKVAHHKGSGSTDDAANFICADR